MFEKSIFLNASPLTLGIWILVLSNPISLNITVGRSSLKIFSRLANRFSIGSINPELFINGSGNLRVLGKQVFKKTLPDYFFSYPEKIRYENNENELFE